VIARDGRVLGEGWHVRRGEPHAERNALDDCREPVVGATAYVSLEPCSHYGRQPPCADALMAAGIARVVCAIADPNPEVDGRGLERLRAAGVQVELAGGALEARARRQNAAFRTHVVRGRPFVLLKLAATLDGRIATSTGESRWISSPESRALVHAWRAEFDASERRIGITKELWYLAALKSGDHLIGYMESANFGQALTSFVGSREPFDVWFKEEMLAVTGVDLNNPPADLAPAELLSHYEAESAQV